MFLYLQSLYTTLLYFRYISAGIEVESLCGISKRCDSEMTRLSHRSTLGSTLDSN